MRLPLPQSRSARCSILATALLLLSAYIPLPLPIGLINHFIALRAPELSLQAQSARMRWGRGRIVLGDLRLQHQNIDRLRIDGLQAFLDMRPWSPNFAKPIRLVIREADGDLDQAVLDSLSKLKSPKSTLFPLQIQIQDSSVRWTEFKGNPFQLADLQVDGFLSADGAHFSIHGNSLLPAMGDLSVFAEAGAGLLDWQVAANADLALVKDWPALSLADLPWGRGNSKLQLRAQGHALKLQKLQVVGSLQLESFAYVPYDIQIHNLGVDISGNLGEGIALHLQGSEAHGDFSGQAALRFNQQQQPHMDLAVHGIDLEVDAPFVSWLNRILPQVGAIVEGLEPRGRPQADFAAHWEQDLGLDWSLHVDASQTQVTYRGFEDMEGNRVSFPYPAVVTHGHLLTGNQVLLYKAEATVGEHGHALSTGTFDFRPPTPHSTIDLKAQEIALDPRISHALTGNPGIAHLWRQLGSPESGTAGIEIFLRFDGQKLDSLIRGEARNVETVPNLLPLPVHGDSVWFEWRPGLARFGGLLKAVGGDLNLSGEAREASAADENPVLRLNLEGQGAAPSAAEMHILAGYLHLPAEIASFTIAGDVNYRLQMILPLGQGPPQLLADFQCNQSKLHWAALDLDFAPLQGQGIIAVHGKDYLISMPRTWSDVDGGKLRASLAVSSKKEFSTVTIFGSDLNMDSHLLAQLQDFTGQEPWGRHIEWGGKVNLGARLNPSAPEDFRARVELNPLSLKVGDFDTGGTYRLQGAIHLIPDGFSADVLHFSGPDVNLALHTIHGSFANNTLQLAALVNSSQGIALASRLPLLASAETLAAIKTLGLRGKVRANNLQIDATLPDQGKPSFRASGGLLFEDVGVNGLSPFRGGQAAVQMRQAWWNNDQDFGAELDLSHGLGKLGEVGLQDAKARVHLDPTVLRFTRLEVSLLGGKISTEGMDRDGKPVHGHISLGLSKEAPVGIRCFAQNLKLEKMRREIGLGGSLAGTLQGYLNLQSPSPEPTFCHGEGRLHIENGVLGTVPVLRSIWSFAGVRPPVFKEGDLEFRINGKGRIYVDRMRLNHDLLEVAGEGTIDLDTNLNLKVTLRTFSVLGRLPILKDLIDLLIEQQVYGPAEAPIIRQRAVGKLGGEFIRPPFPLWVPEPARPDWRRSPVLPVE